MPSFLSLVSTSLLFVNQLATASPIVYTSAVTPRATYPFNQLVAFGDELSGNVYGFGTWTNGPVAVSYLADLLGVPLRDFAFGGCCGGGSFGATLDESYTPSPAGAPSLVTQIANYTSHPHPNVHNALEFIWVGENDLSKHTNAFWQGDPHNTQFAGIVSSKIAASVATLLNNGAPYVLVANIYPKHIAPVTPKYLCGTSTDCVAMWGMIIRQANTAIASFLTQFGNKVIYYDAFDLIVNLANNAKANGFTQPLTYYCDADDTPNCQWDLCMTRGHGEEFFWMNFIQLTTHVHRLIAADMKATIDKHFGM
jgi:cholinesterase